MRNIVSQLCASMHQSSCRSRAAAFNNDQSIFCGYCDVAVHLTFDLWDIKYQTSSFYPVCLSTPPINFRWWSFILSLSNTEALGTVFHLQLVNKDNIWPEFLLFVQDKSSRTGTKWKLWPMCVLKIRFRDILNPAIFPTPECLSAFPTVKLCGCFLFGSK